MIQMIAFYHYLKQNKGIISKPSKTLSFDDAAVFLLLKKLAEKEFKKSLEKN